MTSYVKFPIRIKLLLLMGGFVLIATFAYLALAIQVFKEDQIQLVYELNSSTVKTLAAETEANLLKISDKVKLLTQGHRDPNWTRSVFESEPDLVAFTLYSFDRESKRWTPVSAVKNSDYLKIYGLSTKEIDRIRSQVPIPFEKVLKNKTFVYNSTLPGGAPIFTLALVIEVLGDGGTLGEHVAVADLRMDKLLKILSNRKLITAYLVDQDGKVIAHPDVNLVNQHRSLDDIPIVSDALKSQVKLQLKQFEWQNSGWLGAFTPVGLGHAYVVAQVPEEQAFHATYQLIEKSVLFSLIVVTLALLVSGWVSRSLTEPLSLLMVATDKLSRWEFGQLIHVNTRDEVANLARAFNAMASDLQNQRKQLDAQQSELERKVQERTQALEQQKRRASEAQDALLRTTRLASLGELAGAAAHEVLNPVNNMNIRIERIAQQIDTFDQSDLALFEEITGSWKKAFEKGGWSEFQKEMSKPSQDQSKTLGQEDLENLSAIAGDLMKRTQERSDDMKFLSKEIVRITRIVNNMRALSRVGGERRPLDIHVPLDETVVVLSDLLQKRSITIVKDYSADPRDLFSVVGDKDELVQVFSNLIRNAMHAISSAKRRAGSIRLETKRAENRVEVRITDNGTGISDENLPKMFEPNFTTKSVEEGTGLGLSISRRLIRAFGGDIELEKTVEGVGTTFLIWFPTS